MFNRYFSLFFIFVFKITSTVYAVTGAGVLPFFDDGTVLLGKEMRHHGYVWSDFGGKTDPNETLAQTAHREANEEMGGTLKHHITLARVQQAEANGHYVDHNHVATGLSYRMYFLNIPGPKPSIVTFHQNAPGKAHVDKTDWGYFDASFIKNAHNMNGNIPGTNEPVYGPMKACIRKPVTQQFFTDYINSVGNLPAPQLLPVPAPQPVPVPAPAPQKYKAPQVTKKPASKVTSPPHVTRKVTQTKRQTPLVTRKVTQTKRQTRHVTRKVTQTKRQTRHVTKRSPKKITKMRHPTKRATAAKRSRMAHRGRKR